MNGKKDKVGGETRERKESITSARLKSIIEKGMKEYREGRARTRTREEIRAMLGLDPAR